MTPTDFIPDSSLSRRDALRRIAALSVAAVPLSARAAKQEPPSRITGMGLVIYDCKIRRDWMKAQKPGFDLFEPMNFLNHCRRLGAGGMQAALGIRSDPEVRDLRGVAEQHGMYIEAIVSPPRDAVDSERFEAELKTARAAGALAARTVIIPGRRYERFQSLAEFRKFEQRGEEMLQRAAPIAERLRIPLAVENHKDQRINERVALFQRIDSEYVGACVDTGNSFALMDDPYGAVEALSAYAHSVHLKDQAVQTYEDGFLLGDIPLGQGSFDLRRMVRTLQKAKPQIKFSLELITRPPLKVPCLRQSYWRPMPEDVPARDLIRNIHFVKDRPTEVQTLSGLTLPEKLALEDANVAASLKFAGEELGL